MVYFKGSIKMFMTQNSCMKISQTVNYSTLRKTCPEKAVVFLLITVRSQERIGPKHRREIVSKESYLPVFLHVVFCL